MKKILLVQNHQHIPEGTLGLPNIDKEKMKQKHYFITFLYGTLLMGSGYLLPLGIYYTITKFISLKLGNRNTVFPAY